MPSMSFVLRARGLSAASRACRVPFVLVLAAIGVLGAGCAKSPQTAGDAGPGPVDADGDLAGAPRVGAVTIPLAGAHDIQPMAFGQNYWNWEPTLGNATGGTEALVRAAGVKLIRAGGANNELETPNAFTNGELDRFVTYCKTAGAEPVIQVPLIKNAAGAPATPDDAAAMVTYANTTMAYGVKYWSIGNEPDLYTSQSLQPATYAATDYCATFKAYATAMKAADPSITILGPELSWKYVAGNDWLTPFLDGCKDFVDVVSVHRYPFAPTQASVTAAFTDATNFRQLLRSLRANLDKHGMTAIPLAITEEHITYNGEPAMSTQPASPQTFYAGMWAADVMGVALEENLWTGAFWHIADSASGWKLAFILGQTPAPTYYAMATVANNFSGRMLAPTGVPAGFSVYASRDVAAAKTVVMVLNKTGAAARLSLAIEGLPPQELGFPGESLTLATFADAAAAPTIVRYTKAMADGGVAPAPDL